MAKKTSNLRIVQQQTPTEAELKAEKEKREDSYKLTRQEIGNRVREIRLELEEYRSQLEGMPFDVVTGDVPRSVDYVHTHYPIELAERFNPWIPGYYDRLYAVIPPEARHERDELWNLKDETADTAFQIGVLAGAMFAGCSDREIDRLERGLIHATVSRSWRHKEVGRGN